MEKQLTIQVRTQHKSLNFWIKLDSNMYKTCFFDRLFVVLKKVDPLTK